MTTGERLRQIRRDREMSVRDVAEALGMSEHAVASHERDLRELRVSVLKRYADLYRVPVRELLDDEGEDFSTFRAALAAPARCDVCRWWGRERLPVDEIEDVGYGKCRRRSPKMTEEAVVDAADPMDQVVIDRARWAWTRQDEWCGDHEPLASVIKVVDHIGLRKGPDA